MIVTPSQDRPSAPESLRGQIYRAGITIGIASAFLVGGFSLAFGVEEITAVGLAMTSFLIVGTLSWLADLLVGPALERVAQQREEERLARERELAPSGGGVLPSVVSLTGGLALAAGANGGVKGRRLDITLPEETVASVPGTSIGSGLAGAGAVPAPPSVAFGSAGGAIASAPTLGGGAPGSAPLGQASVSIPASEEFQDLASLLREASQPVPVPAARPR